MEMSNEFNIVDPVKNEPIELLSENSKRPISPENSIKPSEEQLYYESLSKEEAIELLLKKTSKPPVSSENCIKTSIEQCVIQALSEAKTALLKDQSQEIVKNIDNIPNGSSATKTIMEPKYHTCDTCDRKFTGKSQLVNHKRCIHNQQSKRLKKIKPKKKNTLSKIIGNSSNGSTGDSNDTQNSCEFRCSFCKANFLNDSELAKHIEQDHTIQVFFFKNNFLLTIFP